MESRANIDAAQAEIEKIGREEGRLMDLYLKEAISIEAVKERGDQLKLRKTELNAFLSTADEPLPSFIRRWRSNTVSASSSFTLQDDCEEKRVEAANVIRSLVEDIVLTPVDGKVEIDVRGDLAGILTIAAQRKKPLERGSLVSLVKLVAGAGFEPAAFRL